MQERKEYGADYRGIEDAAVGFVLRAEDPAEDELLAEGGQKAVG